MKVSPDLEHGLIHFLIDLGVLVQYLSDLSFTLSVEFPIALFLFLILLPNTADLRHASNLNQLAIALSIHWYRLVYGWVEVTRGSTPTATTHTCKAGVRCDSLGVPSHTDIGDDGLQRVLSLCLHDGALVEVRLSA